MSTKSDAENLSKAPSAGTQKRGEPLYHLTVATNHIHRHIEQIQKQTQTDKYMSVKSLRNVTKVNHLVEAINTLRPAKAYNSKALAALQFMEVLAIAHDKHTKTLIQEIRDQEYIQHLVAAIINRLDMQVTHAINKRLNRELNPTHQQVNDEISRNAKENVLEMIYQDKARIAELLRNKAEKQQHLREYFDDE